jgi:Carboxypeptidase regulatory-like domain
MAMWAALAVGILPQFASVVGVAVDSLRGGPLRDATVVVSDAGGRQATTDAAGRFQIDSIPPGTHRVALFHPLLDALGFSVSSAPMPFTAGDTVRLAIATPTALVLVQRICTEDSATSGRQPTAIIGTVLGDADGATVTLEWKRVDATKRQGVLDLTMRRQATSDASGRFRVCGPPGVTQGRLRATLADAATSWVPIELSRGGVVLPTLHLIRVSRAGRAIGQVVGPHHEKVPGATVELTGTDARTTTDDNGRFVLAALPEGTQTLAVRAAGYSPSTTVVEIAAAAPWQGVVQLGAGPPVLSTIHILAQALAPAYDAVGFNERKHRGVGTFLDVEDIDRKHPSNATDVMESVPGIYVDHSFHPPIIMGSRGHSSVMGSSGVCVNLFLDGHRVDIEVPADTNNLGRAAAPFVPLDLDQYVDVADIAAVEVYNPEELPPQFERVGDSCQTIILWTKGALLERH